MKSPQRSPVNAPRTTARVSSTMLLHADGRPPSRTPPAIRCPEDRPDGDGRHFGRLHRPWHRPARQRRSPEKLVSKLVYIRWEPPHGWSLGTITHKITSSTPRLFKKYKFKVKYIDGSTGPANLPLENYASGPRLRRTTHGACWRRMRLL